MNKMNGQTRPRADLRRFSNAGFPIGLYRPRRAI